VSTRIEVRRHQCTTTTFGAHRGANKSAGRITSGRDLHRLLGGLDISITSKHFRSSSSSWADLNSPGPAFDCPGSTPAFPCRHSASSGQHIYASADIFMSRPTLVGPGSTTTLPGRHISFSGRYSRIRAGISQPALLWPELIGSGPALRIPSQLGLVELETGAGGSYPSGWASFSSIPSGPSRFHRSSFARSSRPPRLFLAAS
jgi:hypothetical protein